MGCFIEPRCELWSLIDSFFVYYQMMWWYQMVLVSIKCIGTIVGTIVENLIIVHVRSNTWQLTRICCIGSATISRDISLAYWANFTINVWRITIISFTVTSGIIKWLNWYLIFCISLSLWTKKLYSQTIRFIITSAVTSAIIKWLNWYLIFCKLMFTKERY